MERQALATLDEARLEAERAEALFGQGIIAQQERDGARANLVRAEATLANVRAQITAARAALDNQRTALGKATIRSPIDGIVLQRQVEPGRTVTASFQTPVLFVLAADLTRMTLALDIDEADVGRVAAGQSAEFTVDAYPERTFSASVRSVRNAARTVEGVVTYPAILDVANDDLVLRPGMTATATITTATVHDALLVPNAALRFVPEEASGGAPSREHRVWTQGPDGPVPIGVEVGLSDGQWTEVRGDGLVVETAVIVGTADSAAEAPAQSPPLGRGRGFGLIPGGPRVR
jgi:HlyD family secretion protein